MRDEVFTWIKMRVGNGQTCRFWTENWSPYGSLETFLLGNSQSRLGIARDATLADLNLEGNWMLPPARTQEQLQVQIYLTTVLLTEDNDCYEWLLEDQPTQRYNTSAVYSFLVWLFTLNRCPTRDRLLGWGLQTDATCLLCNSADESRDHLLFQCSYSWDLWCYWDVKRWSTGFERREITDFIAINSDPLMLSFGCLIDR